MLSYIRFRLALLDFSWIKEKVSRFHIRKLWDLIRFILDTHFFGFNTRKSYHHPKVLKGGNIWKASESINLINWLILFLELMLLTICAVVCAPKSLKCDAGVYKHWYSSGNTCLYIFSMAVEHFFIRVVYTVHISVTFSL